MIKKTLFVLTALSSLSIADMIGGEINLGYYTHAPSGTAIYQGSNIDVEKDLKWVKNSDVFLKAYIEHPFPLLPNLKLGYTNFSHAGSGKVNKAFSFAGQSFALGTDVDSTFDLQMYDITFYYEILDNWLNVDVGLNVKYMDGSIGVKGSNILTSQLIDENTNFQLPIPMLYGKVRFDVPTTDVSLQAEGNYITYQGHTLYDAEIGARYTVLLGLGVEVGYKTMKLKLDDIDDLSMDTDYSGLYGKLVWDF